MDTISRKRVEEIWGRVSRLDEEQSRRLAERALREQPAVLAYLDATDREVTEGSEDRGLVMEIGAVILEVMRPADLAPREVGENELLAAEEANFQLLEGLAEGAGSDFVGAARNLIESHNQAPLMGVVLEALMEAGGDDPETAPDNAGLAFFYLKTVIDCLDR